MELGNAEAGERSMSEPMEAQPAYACGFWKGVLGAAERMRKQGEEIASLRAELATTREVLENTDRANAVLNAEIARLHAELAEQKISVGWQQAEHWKEIARLREALQQISDVEGPYGSGLIADKALAPPVTALP